MVGNKGDLKEQREVSFEEGQEKARELGVLFYETSAKFACNINEMLEQVIFFLLEAPRRKGRRVSTSGTKNRVS